MRGGFPESNVRMLLNHDATRDAIEDGITDWLVGNARPGDSVVIFYAGHGSQMWDEDGDEDDGLDETIAPADVVDRAISILRMEAGDGMLDPDIVELFAESQVYRKVLDSDWREF